MRRWVKADQMSIMYLADETSPSFIFTEWTEAQHKIEKDRARKSAGTVSVIPQCLSHFHKLTALAPATLRAIEYIKDTIRLK